MAQAQIKTQQEARKAVTSFFDALNASTQFKLADTLRRSRLDPESLAQKMLEAVENGPFSRKLVGRGLGKIVSAAKGNSQLGAISVDDDVDEWAAAELLGAGDIAVRLGVARASLDNWRRAHKALALRKGVRNYLYPLRQFERRGPVAGLDRVRAHFCDDQAAWE